jgi:hypothetical protein
MGVLAFMFIWVGVIFLARFTFFAKKRLLPGERRNL